MGIVMSREQEFWEVEGEEEEGVIPVGNFVLRYKSVVSTQTHC